MHFTLADWSIIQLSKKENVRPTKKFYNMNDSMVDRLISDRDVLIQDGLSYFNGTTLKDVASDDQVPMS